jgi:hypothetical protein
MGKRYNGWTNYETWNVALWLNNEEGSYRHWTAEAQDCYDNAKADNTFTRDERATIDLTDALKDSLENDKNDMLEASGQTASMWADLVGAALSEVNWYEIAEHYIEKVDKEEEAEVE